MASNPSGDDNKAGNPYVDMDGDVHANGTTIYMEDANIVLGSTTGTQIGTATTDKVAFHGSTPTDQCAAYTQTYSTANRTVAAPTAETLTDSTTGSASNTLAAGAGVFTLPFQFDLADIADGDLVTDYVLGYKFKILAVDFACTEPATTGSKATTLSCDIGATPVTGGAVALTSANCTPAGAVVAGSAVTAANTGSAAAAFTVRAASTTAFAEGKGVLLVKIQNMDTADAFASLVDEQAKAAADDLDNRQTINAIIDDLQEKGLAG